MEKATVVVVAVAVIIVGEFPGTYEATDVIHDPTFPCDMICCVTHFHLCILLCESRLAADRWFKASHQLEWARLLTWSS